MWNSDIIINSWCCFVDTSWVSAEQKAGFGWILMDDKGMRIMYGSSSLDPLATALEAKAYALREAVQQIKKLGYRYVTFCGDIRLTFEALKKCCRGEVGGHQDIAIYCDDIRHMISQCFGYRFWEIPREANN